MACTFTLKRKLLDRDWCQVVGTAVFDSSYATGGEVLDLSAYFNASESPVITVVSKDATYDVRSDGGTAAANKVIAIVREDGSEAGSTSDLSTVGFTVIANGPAY